MRLKVFDLFVKCVAYFFVMVWAGSILAAQEKICGNTRALFQCQVHGGKNLALCSNYVDGELAGIQYRFGREKKKELVFPASIFDFKEFKSNHFIRYQVDYKRVKFFVGPYLYSIYSDYEGEDAGAAAKSAGVIISNSSEGPDVQLPCVQIYVDKLNEIIPHVECDVDDALGCK